MSTYNVMYNMPHLGWEVKTYKRTMSHGILIRKIQPCQVQGGNIIYFQPCQVQGGNVIYTIHAYRFHEKLCMHVLLIRYIRVSKYLYLQMNGKEEELKPSGHGLVPIIETTTVESEEDLTVLETTTEESEEEQTDDQREMYIRAECARDIDTMIRRETLNDLDHVPRWYMTSEDAKAITNAWEMEADLAISQLRGTARPCLIQQELKESNPCQDSRKTVVIRHHRTPTRHNPLGPTRQSRTPSDWGSARALVPNISDEQNSSRLKALKRLQDRLVCLVAKFLPPIEWFTSFTKLKTVALWKMILCYVPAETSLLKKELEDLQAYQCHVTDQLIRLRRQ